MEFCDNGDVVLRDLNSSNGCCVNGVQLKDGMPIFLNNNDKLNFGKGTKVLFWNKQIIKLKIRLCYIPDYNQL